jgi:hypothetical protein
MGVNGFADAILTRRKFLTACGATLAVGVASGWASAAGAITGRKHWMVTELTLGLFEKHVGEMFTVSHPQVGDVVLKLVSAVDSRAGLKKRNGGPAMETFAAHFEGAVDNPLPQDTFRFAHPTVGTFDLFMVPVVSRDPGVRRYEVIVNRLLA